MIDPRTLLTYYQENREACTDEIEASVWDRLIRQLEGGLLDG